MKLQYRTLYLILIPKILRGELQLVSQSKIYFDIAIKFFLLPFKYFVLLRISDAGKYLITPYKLKETTDNFQLKIKATCYTSIELQGCMLLRFCAKTKDKPGLRVTL